MAIRQRKDGRWVAYYRAKDGSGRQIEEYFGRGDLKAVSEIVGSAPATLSWPARRSLRKTSNHSGQPSGRPVNNALARL